MNDEKSCDKGSSLADCSTQCPICLEPIKQEAYLDRCFHKFCYHCIAHWAKFVASQHTHSHSPVKCPLCKGDNFSIIHGCDGDSFQQHYINQGSFSFSRAHKYRLQCYYGEPGAIFHKFNILQYWKCYRYLQPNKWLQSWLRREIQALTQEEDVDIILHHVLGVIESFLKRNEREHFKGKHEQKREEFKALVADAARPFVIGRTERFVNELELFLVSGLNIEAYDEIYMRYLGSDTRGATGEILEETHGQTTQVQYLHFFDEDMDRTDSSM